MTLYNVIITKTVIYHVYVNLLIQQDAEQANDSWKKSGCYKNKFKGSSQAD